MQYNFFKKKRYKILIIFILLIIGFIFYYRARVIISPPNIKDKSALNLKRNKLGQDLYTVEDSWLKKNKYGLWELYVTGNPFELGVKNGKLTKELDKYQEDAFVEELKKMIPSNFYINFLKYMVAWFDRDIEKYVPQEYLKEIYGISFSATKIYEFIAPNYQRILNFHAAHDIGHTFQNLNLVACTAFGVRNTRSTDSTLMIGRNMDFYIGDKFAKNKIVTFYKPDTGYNFVSITWAGFIGVISGMNDQGLTISLNAAKSNIVFSAKTPVSILARNILQHASTIDEAYNIAKNHKTFVAESFLVSSAKDRNFAIIEKSIDTTILYKPDSNELILTNHFQSEYFSHRQLTIENKKGTESVYRWQRTKELLNRKAKHDVRSFAAILRNQKGKNDINIGMGNEMAINQLISHHSVIFKPEQLQIWVATPPYQLGKYIAYDLHTVFSDSLDFRKPIYDTTLTINDDPFKYSVWFKKYKIYKSITTTMHKLISQKHVPVLNDDFIKKYQSLNPEFFNTYLTIGEYYEKQGDKNKATKYYQIALSKAIPKKNEINSIVKRILSLKENN